MADLTPAASASQAAAANPLSQQIQESPAGMTIVSVGGGVSKAVAFKSDIVSANLNMIVQFNIDNTGAGNSAQLLRIGSVACGPDQYLKFNLQPSAADDTVIKDDYGIGCLQVQGFSELANSKPVFVDVVKVTTAVADIQLENLFTYKGLLYDGTNNQGISNVAWTLQKTDQRSNLVVIENAKFLIDDSQFLEYKVNAATKVSVSMHIAAYGGVDILIPSVN